MPDDDARLQWLDVKNALARLPPEQRCAIVLTKVIGVDTETAARALGTSSGAVRALVSRARQRLGRDD
jgi:RNA polymerase sigma-70 factor (ECF subfamily)